MKRYFDTNNSKFNGQRKVIRAGNFWGMHKCHDAKNVDLLKQFFQSLIVTRVNLSARLKLPEQNRYVMPVFQK